VPPLPAPLGTPLAADSLFSFAVSSVSLTPLVFLRCSSVRGSRHPFCARGTFLVVFPCLERDAGFDYASTGRTFPLTNLRPRPTPKIFSFPYLDHRYKSSFLTRRVRCTTSPSSVMKWADFFFYTVLFIVIHIIPAPPLPSPLIPLHELIFSPIVFGGNTVRLLPTRVFFSSPSFFPCQFAHAQQIATSAKFLFCLFLCPLPASRTPLSRLPTWETKFSSSTECLAFLPSNVDFFTILVTSFATLY